jgi:hypothetical protein
LKKCDLNLERAGDYLMNHMGEDLEEDQEIASDWKPHPGPGIYDL